MITKRTSWTLGAIRRVQMEVKTELQQEGEGRSKLEGIVQRVKDLESDTSTAALMRRYVLVVSALIHHLRYRGLKASQVNRLFEMGTAILKAERVNAQSSTLGFLYGDLYHVRSQLYHRQGETFRSAWDHQMAVHLSRRAPEKVVGSHELSGALRQLRMGMSGSALEKLDRCLAMETTETLRIRAHLEKIRLLRLALRFEEAQSFIEVTRGLTLNQDSTNEVAWEEMCLQAQVSGDLAPLFRSCLKGHSHHDYSYIYEVFLWSRGIESRKWIERYGRARAVARNAQLKPRGIEFLSQAVLTLEQAYDKKIPYFYRLDSVGTVLNESQRFLSVHTEVLFLAACSRWLLRNRSSEFARLPLEKYHALCLQLTQGRSDDLFALFVEKAGGRRAA